MIWATVSSRSCFCWLYRVSPSLAAKNIINLISVLTIWWCPCVESSLVLLEEGFCYDSAFFIVQLSHSCMTAGRRTHPERCAHQDPGERSSDPTRDWPRLAHECPEVSSGGMGGWWPAAGLWALSVAVRAWDLLKEVTIIFITSIIVWPQVKQQGALPINRKLY